MLRLRLKPKPLFSLVHTKKNRFKTVRFQDSTFETAFEISRLYQSIRAFKYG